MLVESQSKKTHIQDNKKDTSLLQYNQDAKEAFLTLLTNEGIRIISFNEIKGFTFCDPKIQADINRALDLIIQSRDSDTRNLTVKLASEAEGKSRKVSLSYVIPTPIWKVSYRLDLSQEKPFLQGWAIVDNDSDTDWEQVELALVTGKPVSFIQNLYAPYHTTRPTLPLAIAGIAKASTYESGTGYKQEAARGIAPAAAFAPQARARYSGGRISGGDILGQSEVDSLLCATSDSADFYSEEACDIEPELNVDDLLVSTFIGEGMVETAHGRNVGDQFEFTIKHPVSLQRQQSSMIPIVEGAVHAEKMLVFSANKVAQGKVTNPAIGAKLVNNTGMKLPAGPITIYDGGTYAGDSLIAFFPESEQRIISYGEDLSVTGSFTKKDTGTFNAVAVRNGAIIITNKRTTEYKYTFRNASNEIKRLVVEHPYYAGGHRKLVLPTEYMEKTHNLYRFELAIPLGELNFLVKEEELLNVSNSLTTLHDNAIVAFSIRQEFPKAVQEAFKHAVELKQKVNAQKEKLKDYKNQLQRLLNEQERTRKNIEAAGAQTQQGQTYLSRLVTQDSEIDKLYKSISVTEEAIGDRQHDYDIYIQAIVFDE